MSKITKPTKPFRVPKFVAKTVYATSANNSFGLVNRWIIASNANRLWEIKGDLVDEFKKLIIWVCDTGVNTMHPQLRPLKDMGLLTGKSYVAGEAWNTDGHGHGSHTLSNIVSYNKLSDIISHNWIVLSIIPYQIKNVHMCKVLNNEGQGDFNAIKEVLIDIKNLPDSDKPHIVNLSLSGPKEIQYLALGEEIMQLIKELSRYTLFIVAAGNTGMNPDKDVQFPACIEDAYAISNIQDINTLSFLSSRGERVDYGFFGKDQLGASGNNDGYTVKSGTSMAAPAFASCAAYFLCCMSKLGLDRITSIWSFKMYLRQKKLLFDYGAPGEDDFTGEGIIYISETLDLKTLFNT